MEPVRHITFNNGRVFHLVSLSLSAAPKMRVNVSIYILVL